MKQRQIKMYGSNCFILLVASYITDITFHLVCLNVKVVSSNFRGA